MRRFAHALGALVLVSVAATACAADRPAPVSKLFAAPWNAGVSADEPAFQTQMIDADTLAIRQSIRTSFEAPFLYLLFGRDRALLIDSGAGGADVRAEVDRRLAAWLAAHGRREIPLVVMHTHGHGDHVAGDVDLAKRPDTVVVGHTPEAVATFFAIPQWPASSASYDLGGRIVDIVPTPGHHPSHVMVFDRRTRILFSGDAFYPGRLYFRCDRAQETLDSLDRAAAFARTHRVTWLLGAHIEMRAAPGETFGQDDKSRRNEHLLELPAAALDQARAALAPMVGHPRVTEKADFVLFPHPADPRGRAPPDWCDAP